MPKYLIDVNLPYRFTLWNGVDYMHQFDLGDEWSDEQIWDYAKNHGLTIISKDADFSNKILFRTPPPRVIHIRTGNMRMKDFHAFLNSVWDSGNERKKQTRQCLIDRIEGIN